MRGDSSGAFLQKTSLQGLARGEKHFWPDHFDYEECTFRLLG